MDQDRTTEDDLRASRARIVASAHAGRRSIERMLHDGAQQHLVAMAVKLRLAEAEVDNDPEQAKRTLAELRTEVQSTIGHLRDLAHRIYPPLLADRGLPEALNGAASRATVPVSLTVAGDGTRRYPSEIEAAVYFSVLEAIEGATGPISVWVGEEAGCVLFEVWGAVGEGPSLVNIQDRTDTIGGTVEVGPASEGGLHLRGRVPVV
jgi:signal transduction histidine kinase